MWKRVEEAGSFLYQHRNKVAVGASAVVAVGIMAAVYYSFGDKPTDMQSSDKDEGGWQYKKGLISPVAVPPVRDEQLRVADAFKRMARVRDEFDNALRMFIPTLHLKVVNVVDVVSTMRRLRELKLERGRDEGAGSDAAEEQLWDDIKVASFALLLVTAYMLCSLSVLLKIHLHLLSNPQYLSLAEGAEEGSWKKVLDGTYHHLFEQGVDSLYTLVHAVARDKLHGWRVKEKLQVDYSELTRIISEMRGVIEGDMTALLKDILIRIIIYSFQH
jgi:hypothetical protein